MIAATSAPPPTVVRAGADSNGCRMFLVPSASGTKAAGGLVYHVVREEGGKLCCSCPAARYGKPCRHTQAVADFLLEQVKASLDRAEAARRPARHESAPPARSNAPFSIWRV
jgi:hypothetical protein